LELTKYIGTKGLVLQTETQPTQTDLLTEMQNFGLKVSYLDTSGTLVRVPVTATSGMRPDKSNEKSGWYCINEVGGHTFANFGNWRNGSEQKWSSTTNAKLSQQEREDLAKRVAEARKLAEIQQKERQNEVAVDCANRFASYQKVTEHQYLTSKKIKNFGLRANKEALVVPIYNISGEIRSLQMIQPNSDKRFVSGGQIKGNLFLLGTDFSELNKLDTLIVCEGYATAASIYMATKLPVACVFSANFGYTAVQNIRTKTDCKIILAFDNDKSGLGESKAQEIASSFYNVLVRVPSIPGDFNDLHNAYNLEKVKLELLDHGFGITKYSIKNYVDAPPERVWLVDRMIETSKPSLLASIGGVGKSMLSLKLGLAVCGAGNGQFLEKDIKKFGNVVVISAEDDQEEVHRRIDALDPKGKRFKSMYDMFTFTVPDYGQPVTLLKDDQSGLGLTPAAHELMEELRSIDNLALVVIDPIQSFVGASITTSQEAAQLYCQFCAAISSQLGASTLSIHHMTKTMLTDTDDPMAARGAIRGASALTDGHRMAMAIWLASEGDVQSICAEEGLEYDRTRVVRAGVVKSNAQADTRVMTLIRRDVALEVYNKGDIDWT
jgi:phage/plasmid primase-like uncharacterized protein